MRRTMMASKLGTGTVVHSHRNCCLLLFILALLAPSVNATVMYTYTGNPTDTVIGTLQDSSTVLGDRLLVSFVLSTPLGVFDHRRFNIGQIRNVQMSYGSIQAQPRFSSCELCFVDTDAQGNIDTWFFRAIDGIFLSIQPARSLVVHDLLSINQSASGLDYADSLVCSDTLLSDGNLDGFCDEAVKPGDSRKVAIQNTPGQWTMTVIGNTNVPEPSTIMLLLLGGAGIIIIRLKRQYIHIV